MRALSISSAPKSTICECLEALTTNPRIRDFSLTLRRTRSTENRPTHGHRCIQHGKGLASRGVGVGRIRGIAIIKSTLSPAPRIPTIYSQVIFFAMQGNAVGCTCAHRSKPSKRNRNKNSLVQEGNAGMCHTINVPISISSISQFFWVRC
jgi:hypothetical protein